MSNPGSQVRGNVQPMPQPRSVSPGGQGGYGNVGVGDARNYQPMPLQTFAQQPLQSQPAYSGRQWHPQGQGVLAPPANQMVYTQPTPPMGIQHRQSTPNIMVTAPPSYNQAPIYNVPPSQPYGYSYPPPSYGGYSYPPYVGSQVGTQMVGGGVSQGYSYGQGISYREPRESERRVTYHPYTRYYMDYEQQAMMMPVQKVRTKYYQKVYEINYVPKAIEEVVMQVKPVEKKHMKVEYVPVQRKIIHLPQDEKMYQLADPQKHPELKKKMEERGDDQIYRQYQKKQMTSNSSQPFLNLQYENSYSNNQGYNQKKKVNSGIRESQVEEVYSSTRNERGEKDRYTIKVN